MGDETDIGRQATSHVEILTAPTSPTDIDFKTYKYNKQKTIRNWKKK